MADIVCDMCSQRQARYMIGDMSTGQQVAVCEPCRGTVSTNETPTGIPEACQSCQENPPYIKVTQLETGDTSYLCLMCFVASSEILADDIRRTEANIPPAPGAIEGEEWESDPDGFAEPAPKSEATEEATDRTPTDDEPISEVPSDAAANA